MKPYQINNGLDDSLKDRSIQCSVSNWMFKEDQAMVDALLSEMQPKESNDQVYLNYKKVSRRYKDYSNLQE